MAGVVPSYTKRGFCCVVFDSRWRGGLSWGATEAQDAADVVNWLMSSSSTISTKPNFVMLHGMSQGGVAAVLAAGLHSLSINALIVESAYASPAAMMSHLISGGAKSKP